MEAKPGTSCSICHAGWWDSYQHGREWWQRKNINPSNQRQKRLLIFPPTHCLSFFLTKEEMWPRMERDSELSMPLHKFTLFFPHPQHLRLSPFRMGDKEIKEISLFSVPFSSYYYFLIWFCEVWSLIVKFDVPILPIQYEIFPFDNKKNNYWAKTGNLICFYLTSIKNCMDQKILFLAMLLISSLVFLIDYSILRIFFFIFYIFLFWIVVLLAVRVEIETLIEMIWLLMWTYIHIRRVKILIFWGWLK